MGQEKVYHFRGLGLTPPYFTWKIVTGGEEGMEEQVTDLITKSMSSDHDGLHPTGDRLGDSVENDWLTKDRPTKYISDLSW